MTQWEQWGSGGLNPPLRNVPIPKPRTAQYGSFLATFKMFPKENCWFLHLPKIDFWKFPKKSDFEDFFCTFFIWNAKIHLRRCLHLKPAMASKFAQLHNKQKGCFYGGGWPLGARVWWKIVKAIPIYWIKKILNVSKQGGWNIPPQKKKNACKILPPQNNAKDWNMLNPQILPGVHISSSDSFHLSAGENFSFQCTSGGTEKQNNKQERWAPVNKLTSALCITTSSSTTAACPFRQAKWSGVSPPSEKMASCWVQRWATANYPNDKHPPPNDIPPYCHTPVRELW